MDEMTDLELKEQAIREYTNLQRIKAATDKEKELLYQEKILKARLAAMGIPTDELEIN